MIQTFRGLLFTNWSGTFFAVSYNKPALVRKSIMHLTIQHTVPLVLYRVFQLDLPQIKCLLGPQKCTFKSKKWYLHIHEMRNFDKEIFNLPTFMFLWSQSLHISQIHRVFCRIFAGIKTKTSQNSLYSTAFFKILKKPALVQKPTIPHMKVLILSFLEPQG